MSTPRLPTLGGPPGSNFNVSPRLPRPRANASHESSPRGRRAGRDSKEGKERKHAHFERGERSLPASVSPTEEPTGAASAAEEPSASELPFRKAKFKEIKALAKVFDARLGTRPVEARSVGMFVTWNDLYNHMDSDGSGHVDGGEFEWMVRKELGIHAASLPDVSLRGLFAALDHDGSGFISFGEFAHFMRYYSRPEHVDGVEEEPAIPGAVTKLGEKYRGQKLLPPAVHGNTSWQLPSGVTILSGADSEALDGVDDPHVRYLLFQKSVDRLPALFPRRGAVERTSSKSPPPQRDHKRGQRTPRL